MRKYSFESDYTTGAHPKILEALINTNLVQTEGYGTDKYCEEAKAKIREIANCPTAGIHLLVGGTQTNLLAIAAFLRPWEAVISADSAHIATHESGAIEAAGHKVICLQGENGKIDAQSIKAYCREYFASNVREHMPKPGMVYLSQPTEYGTLYSLTELEAIRSVCDEYRLKLYIDGARLIYALASHENDVNLPDLSRLCDAYYIGGTKAGLLFGEVLIINDAQINESFRILIKQRGALLAKGRLLGVQFAAMFTNDTYLEIGSHAIAAAYQIKQALKTANIPLYINSPTNQIFPILTSAQAAKISQSFALTKWQDLNDNTTVYRICTDWSTKAESVQALCKALTADNAN